MTIQQLLDSDLNLQCSSPWTGNMYVRVNHTWYMDVGDYKTVTWESIRLIPQVDGQWHLSTIHPTVLADIVQAKLLNQLE